MICRLLGHKYEPNYTQPTDPFERLWNDLLGEAMWYEIFDHDCARCGKHFRVWRWTRRAAARMVRDEA